MGYHRYTDEQLLHLMQKSDEQAFTELYNRHWERLSVYVLRVIRSEEEARDIVQEIFLSIWKRRKVLNIHVPPSAYLLKSARNLSIRHIERSAGNEDRLARLAAHFGQEASLSASELLELKELETKVNKAIDLLPPKMKEIYLLSRMENRSYKEIATQLGIAGTTVKKQVSNALKVIRKEIGDHSAFLLCCLFFFKS